MAIVALLISNICVAVGTLIIANTKGGVQVVPDYYAQAVAWDSLSMAKQAANDLGWKTDIRANRDAGTITVVFTDRDDQPLDGLSAVVTLSRPQNALPIGASILKPAPLPGQYVATDVNFGSRGLYDFSITASASGGDNNEIFIDARRLDLP